MRLLALMSFCSLACGRIGFETVPSESLDAGDAGDAHAGDADAGDADAGDTSPDPRGCVPDPTTFADALLGVGRLAAAIEDRGEIVLAYLDTSVDAVVSRRAGWGGDLRGEPEPVSTASLSVVDRVRLAGSSAGVVAVWSEAAGSTRQIMSRLVGDASPPMPLTSFEAGPQDAAAKLHVTEDGGLLVTYIDHASVAEAWGLQLDARGRALAPPVTLSFDPGRATGLTDCAAGEGRIRCVASVGDVPLTELWMRDYTPDLVPLGAAVRLTNDGRLDDNPKVGFDGAQWWVFFQFEEGADVGTEAIRLEGVGERIPVYSVTGGSAHDTFLLARADQVEVLWQRALNDDDPVRLWHATLGGTPAPMELPDFGTERQFDGTLLAQGLQRRVVYSAGPSTDPEIRVLSFTCLD